jgi:hypothetical protein
MSVEYKNTYNNTSVMGSIGNDQKFNKTEPATILFKILLDGTGAVGTEQIDVNEKVLEIKDICYNYQGDKHEPNKVIIIWGVIQFKGCLDRLTVEYKHFSPDGNLLRAELEFGFTEYKDKNEEARIKNQQSPDITHVLQFKAGDRLPSLCKNIYKNSKMFLEIAKINKITDFRNIKPGTNIYFPPLK